MKIRPSASTTTQMCVLAVAATLVLGAPGSLAATSDTPYNVAALDSPDTQPFARYPERLMDAGDLTGDGVRDIFASSYLMDVAGVADAGKVTLVSGRDRTVRYELTAPDLQAGAQFGFYVSVPGDVNGDGRDDIVVGAPYFDVYTGAGTACGAAEPNGCNENQGRAYVFSGATGGLLRQLENPSPQPDEGVFATFGARIGAAGDINADGRADYMIGSPANDVPGGCSHEVPIPAGCRKNEGETFVFSGATGAVLRTYRIPDADRQEEACTALGANPRCGHMSVPQSPGDLTGDGVLDHLVAAYGLRRPSAAAPQFFGRLYLFNGATGALLSRIDQPEADPDAFFGLQDVAPLTPGDVSGDGVPDLYATGFLQNGSAGSQGRAWVFNGAASIAAGTGVLLYEVRDPTPRASEAFGFTASRTDYNRDGRPDLYVSGLAGLNTSTDIFDGRDGSLLRTLALPGSEAQNNAPGNSGSALGWSSRAPGDLNGDGEPDYVAAAPMADAGGNQDQGKLYFFLSGTTPGPAPPPEDGVGPAPILTPPALGSVPLPTAVVRRRRGSLSARVSPSADLRPPFRFRVTGRLALPRGTSRAAGCSGRVSVQVRRGRTTLSTRRVRLRRDCTYSSAVSFSVRRRLGRATRLMFRARFTGNALVSPDAAPMRAARIRRRP